MKVKKIVHFDKRANKEYKKFPRIAQLKAEAIVEVLALKGNLIEQYGKKIDSKLFEIRIQSGGQWRLLYTYLAQNHVVILSAFQKKTQKTPMAEIEKAKNRLKEHLL